LTARKHFSSSPLEYDVIARFGSLGQTTRLAVLRTVLRNLLKVHPDGLNAGDISRMCEVPHNTMSAHHGVLSRAELVLVERQGRVMNYQADLGGFRGLVEFLARDCCGGRPELWPILLSRCVGSKRFLFGRRAAFGALKNIT